MFHYLTRIQPRTIILMALLTAAVMLGSAVHELLQSRDDLFHLLDEHARTLSETVVNSGANIVLSSDLIEQELAGRLLDNARFIAVMDSAGTLTPAMLRSVAAENDLFRINIMDRTGRVVLSNHDMAPGTGPGPRMQRQPDAFLLPLLRGETASVIIGQRTARMGAGERFAVAVRRRGARSGAVIVNMDAGQLTAFRKQVGIGRLLRDIGNDSGIEFVVLQDRDGILAATGAVEEMSTIGSDPVLAHVLTSDTVVTRQSMFAGREVFEVVRRLVIGKESVGVLRIGLSMEQVRLVDERLRRRLIMMSVVLAVLGTIIAAFLAAAKNVRIVSNRLERMQLQTGKILDNMGEAVVSVDGRGVVTLFNRQAELLFGAEAAAVIGQPVDVAAGGILMRVFTDAHAPFECILPRTSSIPDERSVLVTLSSVRSPEGPVESRTAVIRDLTERRRMEVQLQRRDKLTAMGELASGVAHEIRNPLNAIAMIAQRYEREFDPKEGTEEYRTLTKVLKDETKRVNDIIRQFLSFARPKPLEIRPFESGELAGHLSVLFEPQAQSHGIRFTSAFDAVRIPGDRDLLTQAVLNLLQNALAATPAGGEIRLQVRSAVNAVQIEVADTGTGIPAEVKERIFDMYFTTRHEGTGLGLALTHQIISRHGGSIVVRDNVPTGSVFVIDLPILKDQ